MSQNPVPVAGAERLQWAGEPIAFSPEPRCASFPRVVVRGAQDAAVAHIGRIPRGEVLVSRRLDGAFSRWPPTPGEPVQQVARSFLNMPPEVASWGDRLVMASHGGLLSTWDAPGVSMGLKATGYLSSDALSGMYTCAMQDDKLMLAHRTGADLEAAREIGTIRHEGRFWLGAVADDGRLWLALVAGGAHRPGDVSLSVELFRAAEGEITSVASVPLPHGCVPAQIVPRSGGGVWLTYFGVTGAGAQPIAAEGGLEGEPWTAPFGEAVQGERVFARWREGFALLSLQDAPQLLLSDGVRTTRAESWGFGAAQGPRPTLVSSPDGGALLIAYQTKAGFEIARADVSPS